MSSVFKDMFHLPQVPASADSELDALRLDEKWNHVAKFFDYLGLQDWYPNVKLSDSVAETAAFLSIANTFGFKDMSDMAEKKMLQHDKCEDNWEMLDVASDRQDRELGQRALLTFTLGQYNGNPEDFWEMMNDMRLEWQVELARCIAPVLVYGQAGGEDFRRTIQTASRGELKRAVAQFNPA